MLLKDSRGKESTTLTFVVISWLVVLIKYLVSGITLGPLGLQPIVGTGEFGAAVTLILAIWLGREWKDKE